MATFGFNKATLDVLRPVFEDRLISHRADVVWPPRNYDLTQLFVGCCQSYADKPETIDAIKYDIGEANR